ncbi:hypothetical protein [Mesorhizobium caraganae]|uniref:hypothetical protein n=1 Tax=Mesorhizobium caraganae TaxID=483206 RepID=UPI003ED10FD1
MIALSRRILLRTLPLSLAAAALPAVAETQGAEVIAIPSDVIEKIKAWQEALAACGAAHDAYCTSLRAKPIDKSECDRLFQALVDTNETSRWHRDEMMTALRSV